MALKLAFSTLGCPQWGLAQIAQAALDYGYKGIELRALGGELNLLNRPEFSPDNVERTRLWLSKMNLEVCCVDTSCSFDAVDQRERLRQVDVALQYCQLAAALKAPLIRVFPDKVPEGSSFNETLQHIAESLNQVAHRAPDGVTIGLETHGDFASGNATAEIIRRANHPKLAIIWDAANSYASGEPIGESAAAVAPYLAHVHLRDARPEGGEHWTPVLAGRGRVPFAEVVDELRRLGYKGYVSFEWEKYWHPEIEEPEISIPDFASAMGQLANALPT